MIAVLSRVSVVLFRFALLAVLTGSLAAAQVGGPTTRGALFKGTVVISNVNVVAMTSEKVLRNAAVLIRDGRIERVVPGSRLRAPRGARHIDGAGGYLIPGLGDMHTHLYADGTLPEAVAPAELGVMLANGVTTIRLMGGNPHQLRLRGQVARGEVLGPQLWVSGPYLANKAGDGVRVIASVEDARLAVREVVAAGYDFVKITFGITGATYDALVDEARAARIRVVGHVEPAVGVRRALAAGQQIEHLDAYFEGALSDAAPMQESVTQYGVYRPANWVSLDHIDDKKLTELAVATARAGVWSGPTLEMFNRAFGDPFTDDELKALPDWELIPEKIKAPYMRSRQRYWAQPIPRETRQRYAVIRNTLVKRIHDAGGKILAGSDGPDLLMVYGYGLHRELQALVKAGLTPYQALATATSNVAEFLGGTQDFGTIQPKRRADLVLIKGNPLDDIRNTQNIEGVMIGGRWLAKDELGKMIAAAKVAINPPPAAGNAAGK